MFRSSIGGFWAPSLGRGPGWIPPSRPVIGPQCRPRLKPCTRPEATNHAFQTVTHLLLNHLAFTRRLRAWPPVSQIGHAQFIAVAQIEPRDKHHVAPCTRAVFIVRPPPQEGSPPGQTSCDRFHFLPRTGRGAALHRLWTSSRRVKPVTAFVFVFVPATTRKHANDPATALQHGSPGSRRILLAARSQTAAFQSPAPSRQAPGTTPGATVLPELVLGFVC